MIKVGDYIKITCEVKSTGWETGDIGKVEHLSRESKLGRKLYYVRILKNGCNSLWYRSEIKKITKEKAFIEVL